MEDVLAMLNGQIFKELPGEIYYDHIGLVSTRKRAAEEDHNTLITNGIQHKVYFISDTEDYVIILAGTESFMEWEKSEDTFSQSLLYTFII